MSDILSALSVFLVFLTFLLNSIEKEINEILVTRKPETSQSQKLKEYYTQLKKIFFLKSLPITIIYLISFYSVLPKTVTLFLTGKFAIWDFDTLNTIFIFVTLGLLGLTIFSIAKSYQLLKKILE